MLVEQQLEAAGLVAVTAAMQQLFAIVIGKVDQHPYWITGKFVYLHDNDWGPSPTLSMTDVPDIFLTAKEAQDVIDKYNTYDIEMKVATFVRKL